MDTSSTHQPLLTHIKKQLQENQVNPSKGVAARIWSQGQLQWSKENLSTEGLEHLISLALPQFKKYQNTSAILVLCFPLKMNIELESLPGQERTRRGLLGARLGTGSQARWLCPHEVTAKNVELDQIIDQLALKSMSLENPLGFIGEKWKFQELVIRHSGNAWKIEPLLRGKNIVQLENINRATATETTQLMADWMFRSVQPDGRMIYKYEPSLAAEGSGNNMIRQFMATVSLIRWSNTHPEDKRLQKLAKANLDYNLKTFYRPMDGAGVIEHRNKRKLGAMALAALAIFESPHRHQYSAQFKGLIKTIDRMWQPNGSFKTHYKSRKNNAQNFYPGETLLLWSFMLEEKSNPALLKRFHQSFNFYYGKHFAEKPNPAFVPWHTQAYFKIWKLEKNDQLKMAIFQMNDWLLETMQQWDEPGVLPDEKGRFFGPQHPYGPPHASSTGVYLEGLIDAFNLATEVNDHLRSKRYRTAIVRGIRSLRQLQFKDEVDHFYISNPLTTKGAIRTTVSDNTIRVDNVQHNLMGLIKILASFEDYHFNVPAENLSSKKISQRDFSSQDLSFTDLNSINGAKLNFKRANLSGANLESLICWYCDFSGADLRGANLENSEFLPPRFEGALIDNKTKLPFSAKRSAELGMLTGAKQ